MFPDDEAARQWLEKNIWPDGRKRPKCGHDDTAPTKNSRMPYRCRGCNKRFSVRTGTVMAHSHISYRNWVITTYLLATRPKGVSSMQLHHDLGIKQSTTWLLLHKLRKSWHTLTGSDPMSDPVEVDEAYLGGREKNKHTDRKGKSDKTVVVGIGDRNTNTIRARPVPETTKARLEHFVKSNIVEGSKVYTDENRAYGYLANHETVNCGVGEYVRGDVHVNGVESFWAHVRRVYNGTHHRSPKHLHLYVAEAAERLNTKDMRTIDKMAEVVRNMVGKTLTYKQLMAKNTLCGV